MKNIFVGNLDFSVREEAIRALFETYGAVERVSIMTDRETGRSRGFAFVEMTNEGEAERAISALNGSDMSGRALNVNEARPKTDRGPRPGGGVPAEAAAGWVEAASVTAKPAEVTPGSAASLAGNALLFGPAG